MNPSEITRKIERYEALIEQLHQKVEEIRQEIRYLLQQIEELQDLAVLGDEGEIMSYADWVA